MPFEPPSVSVIIPVYNDPRGIRMTLDSVLDQTYPETDYEVLAVDNGSTDETRDVIGTYCEEYPDRVRLLVEDEIQGPAAARNKGVAEANGTILGFIDADMTVEETWLEHAVQSMESNDWSYMGCNVEIYVEEDKDTLTATYNQIFGFPIQKYIEEQHFSGTGCLFVRSEVFDEVGNFDDRLFSGEDQEFGNRVYDAGFDQHYQPAITMYHPARSSLPALLKKHFRHGRGRAQMQRYHPSRVQKPSVLNPRNYLPPHPIRFYKNVTDVASLSWSDVILLFFIAYMKRLSATAGWAYEHFGEGE
ncbi:glycosyltransferase [Haladaptatus paucihalophilus]|uniref:Glycosyl transferase family 2 n=2 Tax=Haladaptatus paucihalophilus DX253 TaxID=797209 RepID=A0A1M6TIL2_HALPU|nr:glycosyltransferase [Haladaptatus paucihalophilus]SHK56754.1 Glycosyl transferase family 2 [Haladaptatus paucihalophilus DX253]